MGILNKHQKEQCYGPIIVNGGTQELVEQQ